MYARFDLLDKLVIEPGNTGDLHEPDSEPLLIMLFSNFQKCLER